MTPVSHLRPPQLGRLVVKPQPTFRPRTPITAKQTLRTCLQPPGPKANFMGHRLVSSRTSKHPSNSSQLVNSVARGSSGLLWLRCRAGPNFIPQNRPHNPQYNSRSFFRRVMDKGNPQYNSRSLSLSLSPSLSASPSHTRAGILTPVNSLMTTENKVTSSLDLVG